MEDNKKEQLPDVKPIEPKTSDPGIAVPEPAPVTLNQEQQLAKDYAQTISATQGVYDQQIQSVDDFVKEAEEKRNALKQQDENYQKRENAYRYIAGLGDTLSGIANLVGTAHGASNQQQTYNGNMIAAKAEESRKARKLEMDKLNERVDEMKARSRELSAAKDLKTAELQAQYNREQRDLKIKQDALAREEAYRQQQMEREDAVRQEQQAWRESEARRAQANADRTYAQNAQQTAQSIALRRDELNQRIAEHEAKYPESSPLLVGDEVIKIPTRNSDALMAVFHNLPEEYKPMPDVNGKYQSSQILAAISAAAEADPAVMAKVKALSGQGQQAAAEETKAENADSQAESIASSTRNNEDKILSNPDTIVDVKGHKIDTAALESNRRKYSSGETPQSSSNSNKKKDIKGW